MMKRTPQEERAKQGRAEEARVQARLALAGVGMPADANAWDWIHARIEELEAALELDSRAEHHEQEAAGWAKWAANEDRKQAA